MQAQDAGPSHRQHVGRQDLFGGATQALTPTATTSAPADQGGTVQPTPTKAALTPAETVDIANQIGLVMPSPWTTLYVGLDYTFGFVDAVRRPAPITGGWLRQVQPLLIFPDYTVNVFPSSGTSDPHGPGAVPDGSDGLCAATIEDYSVGYPFIFQKPGWYMFVVNQTYVKPSIVNNKCEDPIVSAASFFATQTLSIAIQPTESPSHVAPTSAYTVFASVTTNLPSNLPVDPTPTSRTQSLVIGLSVFAVLLAAVLAGLWIYWVRKKRKMEAESLAFSRLKPAEQMAFLLENPQSWLNPANQTVRGRRGTGAGYAGYPVSNGWGGFNWANPATGNPSWPGQAVNAGPVYWNPQMAQVQDPRFYGPQAGSLARH